jgi:hypothetical protein
MSLADAFAEAADHSVTDLKAEKDEKRAPMPGGRKKRRRKSRRKSRKSKRKSRKGKKKRKTRRKKRSRRRRK